MLDHLDELVVKEVHGAGGYGMLVGPASTAAERDAFRARIIAAPGQLHRAADAGAVDLPDVRRRPASRRATSTCGRTCCPGTDIDLVPGRAHARGAARGLAGGQLVAGRRHQGHLGARHDCRNSDQGTTHAEPHRQRAVLDGRHIERAENTARLLDVTYRMSLLPYQRAGARARVGGALGGAARSHRARRPASTRRYPGADRGERAAASWCSTRPTRRRSICCLRAARESARARARRDHLRDVRGPQLARGSRCAATTTSACRRWASASSSTG